MSLFGSFEKRSSFIFPHFETLIFFLAILEKTVFLTLNFQITLNGEMHHARKKTASRTMATSSKRLKSGPDIRSNAVETVRWSEINHNLISDIFSHLFTIQQLKYRR